MGFASDLLRPHADWPMPDTLLPQVSVHDVSNFQLALIAALYIDSTKQAGHTSTDFMSLLQPTNITNITKEALKWADVYDQTKLASYWYMALFQQPFEYKDSIQDIRFVILEAIEHSSEIRLSALQLLDISAKDSYAMASPLSDLFTIHRYRGGFRWTSPGRWVTVEYWLFNDWVLLHLDTLFSPNHIIQRHELARLEWAGTCEQVHIAKARLALYDHWQGQGKDINQTQLLKPEPHLLKLFLCSNDYEVCTGAFKQCLNLATPTWASPDGNADMAGMFIPEAMGCQWIEHLVQVLCGARGHEGVKSWEFLNKNLVPRWDMLPPSWCHDFASEFLFSDVHLYNQPAYQCLTDALRDETGEIQNNMAFLPFINAMLELTQHALNLDTLTSLKTWLVGLPETLKNHDAHVKLETILATREQQIIDETLTFC